MGLKGLAIFAVLLVVTQAPVAIAARASEHSGLNRQATLRSASLIAAQQELPSPTPGSESEGRAREDQLPYITVANPPSTPLPWSLHDRIAWAANLVLAILGYVGIILAISLLKKIDRQTKYAETAADAAVATAQSALLNVQSVIQSERPWILITVEPSLGVENSFTIMATNRGRTPARIIETTGRIKIAIDERHLSGTPEYKKEKPGAPLAPIILLPGESTAIRPFCRDDVRGLCDSEERFKRIETWEEKIYLYGRIIYRDLIAPPDHQIHETNWCCWYIHGRQNSGLVIAGPPEYNSHT
jgi:hypothetical protein